MLTRRDLLKTTLNGAADGRPEPPRFPLFLAETARAAEPRRDGRVLVIIQLDGGNDAINTLVPFRDEGYAKHRNALRIPEKDLIRVNDQVGLHPGLRGLGSLLEQGQLGLVPGVGYPNPNRSHFESMAIWQTARLDPEEHTGPGWIGRSLDEQAESGHGGRPAGTPALLIGDGQPPGRLARPASRRIVPGTDRRPHRASGLGPLVDRHSPGRDDRRRRRPRRLRPPECPRRLCRLGPLGRADTTVGSTPEARYPDTALAGKLRTVAQLLKADLGARVFYTIQSGYDTHAGQSNSHFSLLFELGGAIKAFLDDLTAAKLADRVAVVGFSEFGRRVDENGSAGTDHGTAGLVFLAGTGVRPGVHGKIPSLTDLVDGDPKSLHRLPPHLCRRPAELARITQPDGAGVDLRTAATLPAAINLSKTVRLVSLTGPGCPKMLTSRPPL